MCAIRLIGSADMVETRRSSSASKRALSSPSSSMPNGKRSKVGGSISVVSRIVLIYFIVGCSEFLVGMQAAEASSSSANDSRASEEVIGGADVEKELEVRSDDLANGSVAKQSGDVAPLKATKPVADGEVLLLLYVF